MFCKTDVLKGAPKLCFMHYTRVAFSSYSFGKLVFRLPVFLTRVKLAAGDQPPSAAKNINKL